MSQSKILFVDDQPSLLNAMARHFESRFEVHTAIGGAIGLEAIEETAFAVVVSDMQMPGMNGIEFLQQVRERAPDTVRVMLTSNDDQQTAVEAVNEGAVFRFLNKPCQAEELERVLDLAVEQYHLVTAEKELLEGTLRGSIKLLTDILSMVAPKSFGRALIMQEYARVLAHELRLERAWELELAAMFSVVAYVTVPAETLARLGRGQALSQSEQAMLMRLPESASKLLENIPRMESVRRILYYHQKHFDGEGFPDDSVHGETIPLESRLLKIIADLVRLEARGLDKAGAFAEMNGRLGWYDPNLLMGAEAAFGALLDDEGQVETQSVTVPGLRPGQRLLSNIEAENGMMLYHAGNLITEAIIERINNYHVVSGIREPIDVMIPVSDVGDAAEPAVAAGPDAGPADQASAD